MVECLVETQRLFDALALVGPNNPMVTPAARTFLAFKIREAVSNMKREAAYIEKRLNEQFPESKPKKRRSKKVSPS